VIWLSLILVGIVGLIIGWVLGTRRAVPHARRQMMAGNIRPTRSLHAAPSAGEAGRMSRREAEVGMREPGRFQGSVEIAELLGRLAGAQRERDKALREREEIASKAREAFQELEPWLERVSALSAASGYSQSQVEAALPAVQELKDMAGPPAGAKARQGT
jgi:hypothetical protein